MNEDTIIVGSLEKDELEKSINELVSFVEGKTNKMAEDFTQGLDKMKLAMKDFAVTQKVSVDLMKEAWRSMSSSFDAMVAAESTSGGGGRGRGSKPTYDDDTVGALRESVKHEKKLREEMKLGSEELRKQNQYIEERQRKLKQETTSQLSLNDVMKMQVNSVEDVSRKMAALKKARIDPKNAAEVKLLGDEYQRLSRLQATLLGKNIQLTHSNNYLAQSFGYIRNRIVYALTLGAMTNFVKQIYEVRGQYELLERSLGILIDDMDRGSEIFNELNEMALKSPFTLTELATGAKQLVAYNFAENEVVDTTRRLGDISAALGVPMERLVYNLGQIRAQTVLNARDARDFANAGLAIVPMLAQLYTEQKRFGDQVVTTAQVYDMMSKKMVSYGDVMQVINKITDEGGKFYDFQAKQAETLRVQINNLTLAFNNMLNDIGKEHQGTLTAPLRLLKSLFENWRQVSRVIMTVIATLGAYRAASLLAIGATTIRGLMTTIGAWLSLARGVKSAKDAMALFNLTVKANPLGLLASALTAVLGYFVFFKNNVEETTVEMERFGESGAKTLKKIDTLSKILQGTDETSSTYKKTLYELSQITSEYGIELDAEKARREDVNKAIENTIELVKQESAERQRANNLTRAQDTYDTQVDNARKKLRESLKSAMTAQDLGLFSWKSGNKELRENADAITDIIGGIVESNITLIAGKTGEEYEKGLDRMFAIIQERMKAIGISESTISKEWIRSSLFGGTNVVNEYIESIKKAKNAQDNYVKKTEKDYEITKKATQATMSFTDKVKANSLALQKNASDALALYNNIYDIVDIAKKNHVINFDLKLTAQEPPKWMFDKSLPELQQLAQRFAAIAKSGGHAKGYDVEGTYERALQYASAARTKQEEEERKAREKNTKSRKNQRKEEDVVAEALKQELSLIKEIQSNYTKLRKAGVDNTSAINMATQGYELTLERVNNVLSKYGINKFNASDFAGKNVHDLLNTLTRQRDALIASGKAKTSSLKDLDVEIQKLTIDAKTYDMKKITDGLNNELGKLKDEYELAVELDANPELGDMFSQVFGIDTETLPRSFGEAFEKATNIINRHMLALGNDIKDFDLMGSVIKPDENNQWLGLDFDSDVVKELIKWQTTFRDMFKKNITETEKMLDEYVKKYGDYSDKVAEIESNRLDNIRKLNEAYYTEEMRKRPEYLAKINAINTSAQREEGQARFDEFKNSRLYIAMFENLEYASTATLEAIRRKLVELKSEMGSLSPEQLKQVTQQFEKIDQELIHRNPFKGLIKNIKDYAKAVGKQGKQAQQDFAIAQRKYDYQEQVVTQLKKEKEEREHTEPLNKVGLEILLKQLGVEEEKLKKLKEELDLADQANAKYDAMRMIFKTQSNELAALFQTIAANLQSLAELRDTLNEMFGVELGDHLNAVIDDLGKVGEGVSKVISSAQSGDFVGSVTGVIQTVAGIGDTIASIFGDGSARTRRLNREIDKSRESVRLLNMAYKDLERAVEQSLGSAETAARRSAIANKEAELAELERQMTLEASKRSKDRDDDAIKQYEETIQDLRYEIQDLKDDLVNNLLGSDVKSAAEEFVDTWVDAWRAGETTLDAIKAKMDDMVGNLIKKAVSSAIVERLLQPLYDSVDKYTQENSAGGVDFTTNELKALATLSGELGVKINEALGAYYGNLESLGVITKNINEGESSLSALQAGIQGITEDTAGALEGYMNGVSQQVYLQSDILTQIRDTVVGFDLDVSLGVMSQILLQLQTSYQTHQAIQAILEGWSSPNGMSVRVEMVS